MLRLAVMTMAALLVALPLNAREWPGNNGSATGLNGLMLDYLSKVPQEKLYVHTDRSCYAL